MGKQSMQTRFAVAHVFEESLASVGKLLVLSFSRRVWCCDACDESCRVFPSHIHTAVDRSAHASFLFSFLIFQAALLGLGGVGDVCVCKLSFRCALWLSVYKCVRLYACMCVVVHLSDVAISTKIGGDASLLQQPIPLTPSLAATPSIHIHYIVCC